MTTRSRLRGYLPRFFFLPASSRLSRQLPSLLRSRSLVPPPFLGTYGTLSAFPDIAPPHVLPRTISDVRVTVVAW